MGFGGFDKSAPAQKLFPFPVKITAASSSSVEFAMELNICARALDTSVLKQFFLEGLLSDTMMALLPDDGNSIVSVITTGSDIYCSSA